MGFTSSIGIGTETLGCPSFLIFNQDPNIRKTETEITGFPETAPASPPPYATS
jgi:hypothetical protein